MNQKKKIILSVTGTIIALAFITFFVLGLTIWRPKSTDEWLEIFQNSLNIVKVENFEEYTKNQPLSIKRNITIAENDKTLAIYEQVCSYDLRDNKEIGYLKLIETYPNYESTIDDVCDEYYLNDGTMSMRRENSGEQNVSKFDSDKNILNTIITENLGNKLYSLNKDYFDLQNNKKLIIKEDNELIINIRIKDNCIQDFLNLEKSEEVGFSNVNFKMCITKQDFLLKNFLLTYVIDGKNYSLETEISCIDNILVPDWA